MNKLSTVLVFAFLVQAEFIFAQGNTKINSINYVDSVAYYSQQCLTPTGVDTMLFVKAVEMLSRMDVNMQSIHQVEKISQRFRQQKKAWFANKFEEAYMTTLARSDSMDMAIRYLDSVINAYEHSRNPDERTSALSALLEVRIPLRNKSLSYAFDFYASQLKAHLDSNDSTAIAIVYFCLGANYRLAGLTDMGIYNFKKSLSYINKNDTLTTEPISGLYGWMNHTSVLGQLYLQIGDYPTAIAYSTAAREVKIHKLKDPNVSYLNCNLALAKIKLNNYDSVEALLNSAIRLATKAQDYPSLVRTYEIKGQYFLALNKLDSAEANLKISKELMRTYGVNYFSAADIHTPNYYLAKVRILQNRLKDARELLEEEIDHILQSRKDVLKEQALLIEVYNKLGDSKAAYATFTAYTELQAVLNAEERKYRSKSFEVEAKISEAENTIKVLEAEKTIADLTRNFLIGIAVLLLIVAAVIFNRFRVTRRQKRMIEKEKQRSEELLLNILPAQVAEELKEKGSADAKHFNEVTVMFIDIKGFTQISEKLSPTELVAEIDACFRTFDNIVSKYNVEKIKTIGDAYMCAGGLPLANTTHAIDVVCAAMEIQQYMKNRLQQQIKENKELIEIRIGIHTGQVVAGIVGIKKFAYDIWGDTVNIAARLESSGEAGKINISGSTYELVKDSFRCTHRGKIAAKNKGEIDMYFVESML